MSTVQRSESIARVAPEIRDLVLQEKRHVDDYFRCCQFPKLEDPQRSIARRIAKHAIDV